MQLIANLFIRNVYENKEKNIPDLVKELMKIYSKNYGNIKMIEFIKSRIDELDEKEVDAALDNPSEQNNIAAMRNTLSIVLKDLTNMESTKNHSYCDVSYLT